MGTLFHLLPILSPAMPDHGGHGSTESGSSLLHYLVEPVHLPLTLLGVALLGAVAWSWWGKRSSKR
jgi:hypothetical protein